MNFTWVEPTVEGSASTAAAQRAEGAVVGAVADLWRYPVKSMLGERKTELHVTKGGCVGDRAWALRELSEGRIASAKNFRAYSSFEQPMKSSQRPRAPAV
jgi:uncharacterized protein YcbX